MTLGLIGKKIGMTRRFYENGQSVPVTVLHVEPGKVVDIITKEKRGYSAVLIGFGLIGDKKSRNRFAQMKAKMEQVRINVEINPNLFEQLNIKQVPVIAFVNKSGSVKKISGHISLSKALEIMQTEYKQN